MSERNPKALGVWGDDGVRVQGAESYWQLPIKWDAAASVAGERHRVFCASLADVFEDRAELLPWRLRMFGTIAATPNLDWLLLSKRPEGIMLRLRECARLAAETSDDTETTLLMLRRWITDQPPQNVWLGSSVEDQQHAHKRIPHLLRCPAAVRFISAEPLLASLDLIDYTDSLNWVIVGGESGGPSSRPMHPAWARSLRDQCTATGTPFFFKQWGDWLPVDEPHKQESSKGLGRNERWLNLSGGHGFHGEQVWRVRHVGKAKAGHLLDGREWHEFPATAVHERRG
jgi:protein gp37